MKEREGEIREGRGQREDKNHMRVVSGINQKGFTPKKMTFLMNLV
jgi:hypothetical protein